MQWATGQIFEILAIGNGEFMHRVFLALSMLWSSGMFASLGGLGLLIGLIGLGPQSIAAGGQRMDIGSLFLGFVLWLLFFAGGATVHVQEVGYNHPGLTAPRSWVVDQVPFGVAATGWLVSNVGKVVTEKMEQAYGLVDEEQSVLKTGHGRALEWLSSIRTAADMNIGGEDTQFSTMRANLVTYMRWCSMQAVVRDQARVPRMTYATDPLDPQKGFGFLSERFTVGKWLKPNGQEPDKDITCTDALQRLQDYFQDSGGSAFVDFASTVARPMGFYTGSTPGQQAISAAAQLNLSVDHAQKYMLATMMAGLWHEAAVGSPQLTQSQITNMIMMKQAVEQKATQSAGEESMFRRTMYPLMTFLESAFYITAPFMALVIGMGRIGIGMASKFIMIPLWLAMWLPTLAVINLFQIISFSSVMDGLRSTMLGAGTPYEIGSLASAAHIDSSALDWMATGSMLAAATPMISLMFLMGGAYTATALAGAFKGSDVINEKIPSPDVAQPAAALQASPIMRHSQGGTEMVGRSVPEHSTSATRSDLIQSGNALLRTNTNSFNAAFGKQIQTGIQAAFESGHGGSVVDSHAVQRSMQNTLSLAEASGVNVGDASKLEQGLAMKVARDIGMGAGIDIEGVGAGLGLSGKYKDETALNNAMSRVVSLGASLNEAATHSEALSAAITDTSATMAEEHARQTGTESSSFTGSSAYRQQRTSLAQTMNRQQEMAQQGSQMSTNQTYKAWQVAGAMGSTPTQGGTSNVASDQASKAIENFGEPRLQEVMRNLRGDVSDTVVGQSKFGGDVTERMAYAAYLLNTGQAVGQEAPDAQTAADYAQNRYRIETETGLANTNAGAGAANAYIPDRASLHAGIQEVNDAVGNVQKEVMDQNLGSEKTEAEVRSQHAANRRNPDVSAAHAGGAAARGMEADGGGIDGQAFDSFTQPLQEKAEAKMNHLDQVTRATHAQDVNRMQEEEDRGGFRGSWREFTGTDNQTVGNARLQAMRANSAGNQVDNTMFDQAVAAAMSGNITGFHMPENEAIATAARYVTTGSNGHALSERQMARVDAALNNMTSEQREAQIELFGAMPTKGGPIPFDKMPRNASFVLGRRATAAESKSLGTAAPYNPRFEKDGMVLPSGMGEFSRVRHVGEYDHEHTNYLKSTEGGNARTDEKLGKNLD